MDKQKLQEIIGNNIKTWRVKKSLTQLDLASACNIEQSNLARIEAGNTNPTIYTLHLLALALEVELSDIIKLKD